jgi:uncharacterized protein YggE
MTVTFSRGALLLAFTALAVGIGGAVAVSAASGSDSHPSASPAISTTTGRTVRVSGTGSVEGKPDTLVADLRVHTRQASVQAALNASSHDAAEVISSLTKNGVSGSDIRTTNVSLNPAYGEHGEIVGYDSGESLSVRIQPLTKVGQVLSAASTAAGNAVSIDNLSFDIADNASLLAAARASAFANAKAAASQYARLGGATLSHVDSIKAVVHNATPTYARGVPDALSGSTGYHKAAVPIRPGKQKVSVTVKVVWALQ